MDAAPALVAQQNLLGQPPVGALPVQVQDNGIADLAYQVLKYGTLATVTIGSGMLMTTGLGALLVVGTTIGASYFAISHVFEVLGSLNIADGVDAAAAKVDHAFKIVLWTALIVGAIALGYGGASIFCGASALLSGVQAGSAFEILLSLSHITFALGFTVPFGKWLLLNLHSLDEKISRGIQQLVDHVHTFENMDLVTMVRLLVGYFAGAAQGDNVDIVMLQYLPEGELQEYVRQNAPLFSNEKIQQLVDHYPYVLTYQFLCSCLNDDQINAIIIPELDRAIGSLGQLDAVEQDLQELPQAAQALRDQYREDLSDDEKAGLYGAVTPILERMMAHTNAVSALTMLMRKLPAEDVAHEQAQQKIAQLKTVQARIQAVHQQLMDNKAGSLKSLIIDLSEKTAPKNEEDDLDEESYMTLGSLGWRLHEFKQFAPRLGLPSDNNAMAAVSQALTERGLGTRRDLIQHGILDRQDGQELTRELLIERLGAFVNNHQPAPVAAAIQGEVVEGQAPPAAQNDDWALALHRIAVVANHAFHYISAAALIGVQIYYQPISTLLGIAIGLSDNEAVEGAQLAHIWQASPDYVGQSLDERCRELWWRIIWTTSSIRWGFIGGAWAGFQHADAIRFYARPWINRAVQAMA